MRRFISDFLMECDATFSNNLLRIPLANIVGISNTGRTFSLAFSFIRSESTEDFDFIFSSLDELVFHNVPRPRIVLSDQAKGFINSLRTHWAQSNGTFHQLCEWHIVQKVKKRLVEGAYTKEQQDHIQHLIWKYMHSLTEEKMEEGRRELYYELHMEDRKYMEDHWRSKEEQVLRYYTQSYPNLGAYSTQRNEGHHVAVKQFLNPQITLEQATSRLVEHLRHVVHRLDNEEAESTTKVPRFLDTQIFKNLSGHVTLYAINQLKVEWEQAKDLQDIEMQTCECTIITQFGLPCRHRLASICSVSTPTLIPIPLALLHPRWRIDEEAIIEPVVTWIMPSVASINTSYEALDPLLRPTSQWIQQDRYCGNGQDLLFKSLHELELLHGEILVNNAEGAELMVDRVREFTTALRSEFTSYHPQIPQEFAPAGLVSTLPQRKAKGKAKARTLTGVEMVDRKRKRLRNMASKNDGDACPSAQNETQDCIYVIRSTAPV